MEIAVAIEAVGGDLEKDWMNLFPPDVMSATEDLAAMLDRQVPSLSLCGVNYHQLDVQYIPQTTKDPLAHWSVLRARAYDTVKWCFAIGYLCWFRLVPLPFCSCSEPERRSISLFAAMLLLGEKVAPLGEELEMFVWYVVDLLGEELPKSTARFTAMFYSPGKTNQQKAQSARAH